MKNLCILFLEDHEDDRLLTTSASEKGINLSYKF